eukprot:3511059-Pyramimonas_sp.AAC.1
MRGAVQEHRARVEGGGRAEVQQDALPEGFHGIWEPALSGMGSGNQAGVAILAPKLALATAPPGLGGPVSGPGRVAAARVSCGGRHGLDIPARRRAAVAGEPGHALQ